MKCYNSIRNAETQHLNAQGSRVIIVVGQVGAVKIYVAAVEALSKNERQDETQFTTDIDVCQV
jgi:glutamate mutase epsilon subunit